MEKRCDGYLAFRSHCSPGSKSPQHYHQFLQSGGNNSGSSKEAQPEETKPEEDKKKSAGKESKTSNANKGGWFTSLLGWKSSTPQAVLPDDKNPQVSLNPCQVVNAMWLCVLAKVVILKILPCFRSVTGRP